MWKPKGTHQINCLPWEREVDGAVKRFCDCPFGWWEWEQDEEVE